MIYSPLKLNLWRLKQWCRANERSIWCLAIAVAVVVMVGILLYLASPLVGFSRPATGKMRAEPGGSGDINQTRTHNRAIGGSYVYTPGKARHNLPTQHGGIVLAPNVSGSGLIGVDRLKSPVPTAAKAVTRVRVPQLAISQTEQKPGCQLPSVGVPGYAPKGLGTDGNKPLMRNRERHDSERLRDGITEGNAFSAVMDNLLDSLARVESGGRNGKILGDQGRSRGPFQMQRAAWQEVNDSRQRRGLERKGYHLAFDPAVARSFAREYLTILEKRFTAATGKKPTSHHLIACWNLGFEGFRRRSFSLANVPAVTRKAVEML